MTAPFTSRDGSPQTPTDNSMKLKKIFSFSGSLFILLLFILYPIMSFALYSKYKDKRFILWGILGIIGTYGIAIMWAIPVGLLKIAVAILAAIPYLIGAHYQSREVFRLIAQKESKKG